MKNENKNKNKTETDKNKQKAKHYKPKTYFVVAGSAVVPAEDLRRYFHLPQEASKDKNKNKNQSKKEHTEIRG